MTARTLGSVNSDDLTREQAAQLAEYVHGSVGWTNRFEDRARARHWPHYDKLRAEVVKLHNAAHGVWVTLHYKSCGMGLNETCGGGGDSALDVEAIIAEYRNLHERRDNATSSTEVVRCSDAIVKLKRRWEEREGDDSLHEKAFGGPQSPRGTSSPPQQSGE